jgi:hypothetical protein
LQEGRAILGSNGSIDAADGSMPGKLLPPARVGF